MAKDTDRCLNSHQTALRVRQREVGRIDWPDREPTVVLIDEGWCEPCRRYVRVLQRQHWWVFKPHGMND